MYLIEILFLSWARKRKRMVKIRKAFSKAVSFRPQKIHRRWWMWLFVIIVCLSGFDEAKVQVQCDAKAVALFSLSKAEVAHYMLSLHRPPRPCNNSVKPLWHIMIGTAVVMQTATYIWKERKLCCKLAWVRFQRAKLVTFVDRRTLSHSLTLISTPFFIAIIRTGAHISHTRATFKQAMDEYRANHPSDGHH